MRYQSLTSTYFVYVWAWVMWRLFNSIYIGPTTGKDREAYGDNRVLWEWETRNYSFEYYSSLSESNGERERRGQEVWRHLAAGCSRPLCFGSRDVTGSDMINWWDRFGGQDRTDGGSPGVSVRTGCGSAEPPIPSRLVGRGKGEPSRQELSCVLSPELTFLSRARL